MKRYPFLKTVAGVLATVVFFGLGTASYGYAATSAASPGSAKVKPAKKAKMPKNSFENPDFAYPAEVSANASENLNKAIGAGKYDRVLTALLECTVADAQRYAESADRSVALIDSVWPQLPEPYRGVALLLEASIYASQYNSEAYTYSRRTLPLTDIPASCLEWSRDLYLMRISDLCRTAWTAVNGTGEMPLSRLGDAVTFNNVRADRKRNAASIPGKNEFTVTDFAALRILDLLGGFDCRPGEATQNGMIPFFARMNADDLATPVADGRKLAAEVMEEWLKSAVTRPGSVPAIVAVRHLTSSQSDSDRASTLRDYYLSWKSYPASIYLLRPYNDACEMLIGQERADGLKGSVPEWASAKSRYALFKEALRLHPKADGLGDVENMMLSITAPGLYGSLPAVAMPGQEIKAIVYVNNVNSAGFIIVSVPAGEDDQVSVKDIRARGKVVRAFEVRNTHEKPFAVTDTISVYGLESGCYVVLGSEDGSLAGALKGKKPDYTYTPLNVTSITGLSVRTGRTERDLFFVVRLSNQAPVEGAKVEAYKRDYRLNSRNGLVSLGSFISASDGSVNLPEETSYVRISSGADVWSGNIGRGWSTPEEGVTLRANVFADRAIARPGDKVRFSTVVWHSADRENQLEEGRKFNALLLDASREPVDTLNLVTDSWGRAQGEFIIPQGRMLGQWQIAAKEPDARSYQNLGTAGIRVEEYHLPTFAVSLNKDETGSDGGTLVLEGMAMTFSGMPVSGAEVNIRVVTRAPHWRMWSGMMADGHCETMMRTGADGKFRIVLNPDSLSGTPYEKGSFRLSATVTDAAGETCEAPGYDFSFGSGYHVSPEIASRTEVTDDNVRLKVPVYDVAGMPATQRVKCRVTPDWDAGDDGFETEFDSPVLSLPTENIVSGKYKLSFRLADETDEVWSEANTVFYRSDDTAAPRGVTLWTPRTSVEAPEGASDVAVSVGSDNADNWLLCEVSDLKGESTFKWIKAGDSLVNFDVPAPASNGAEWVNICAMQDMKPSQASIEIIPCARAEKLEIETESFRPAITAGDKEIWKFRFTKGEKPVETAVMAVMSDAALNALQPFTWRFSGNTFDYSSRVSLKPMVYPGATVSFSKQFPSIKYKDFNALLTPDFNTWGYGLTAMFARPLYMSKMTIRGNGRSRADAENEVYVDNDGTVMMAETALAAGAESPKMEAVADMNDMVTTEESADDGLSGEEGGVSGNTNNIPLRPSEFPVAFFLPELAAGEDGRLELKFEVPDYNTTWQLQLLGYTADVQGVTKVMEAVASKQVMARLNAPRFVRTGDKAVLAATLYNNSDTDLVVSGMLEAVDPEGKVIASGKYKGEKIRPSASRVITLELNVPSDLMQISVRAYAMGGGHSDGEETVIPVMPSSEPVIESVPFWLAPGATSYSVKLPKYEAGSMVTLNYCDNPAWACLTALPPLTETDSDNALTLSRNLFANATAYGLLHSSPRLTAGLKMMLDSEEGGTGALTSPLEKDAPTKSVALAATPWLLDARGETLRMQSLNSLTDSVEAQRVMETVAERLKSLQNADGSWSWCKGMQGSEWITARVVCNLSPALDNSPTMSSSVMDMARKGVDFVDKRKTQAYLKAKRDGAQRPFDMRTMNQWLYDRRGVVGKGGVKGTFGELYGKTIEALASGWRELGIYERATAAINLYHDGRKDVASAILQSFGATALTSPGKGMWFDTLTDDYSGESGLTVTARVLEAYAIVDPEAAEVDMLRQWLVMQRQVQDWGQTSATIPVIRGILTSGGDWTEIPEKGEVPVIRLGKRMVRVPDNSLTAGTWSVNLAASEASRSTLSIERKGAGPAWGGVISARIVPVRDVMAASIPPLSVTKEVYLINEAGQALPTDKLKVGDKVRVTVTVKCDRPMDYVALTDSRAACLEPVDALSGYSVNDGTGCYREVRTSQTNLFYDRMPKGTHVFSYDCRVMQEGEFAAGVTTVQSQYSPLMTAHSAGLLLRVSE